MGQGQPIIRILDLNYLLEMQDLSETDEVQLKWPENLIIVLAFCPQETEEDGNKVFQTRKSPLSPHDWTICQAEEGACELQEQSLQK